MKRVINWVVSIALRFIPKHTPIGYGVAMWKYSLNRMENVARITLENEPPGRREEARDENFIKLLQLLHHSVSYMATEDPFYGLWLAFFFKQSQQAWEGCRSSYLEVLHPNLEGFELDVKEEILGKAFELRSCGGLYQIEQLKGDELNTLGRSSDDS